MLLVIVGDESNLFVDDCNYLKSKQSILSHAILIAKHRTRPYLIKLLPLLVFAHEIPRPFTSHHEVGS